MRRIFVYESDGNDIDLLRASIWSVRKYVREPEIYVISDGIMSEDINDVHIIDPSPYLSSVGFYSDRWNRRWPYATLFRLLIPLIDELKDAECAVHLDTDTLVVSERADEIFSTENTGYEAWAAKDTNGNASRIYRCVMQELCKDAYYSIRDKIWNSVDIRKVTYVNAGVTVWYPKNVAANGIEWYRQRLKWFWEAETRCKFEYLDQDFLNSMMITRRDLDQNFNAFAERKFDSPIIRHFVCGTKTTMIGEAAKLGYSYDSGDEKIVVYASDGQDSDRLLMSMNSVRKFIGCNVKFYILTSVNEYPGNPDAELIDPYEKLKEVGLFRDGWDRQWPFECLYRLAVPMLDEFKETNRVLYLDTDVLVRSRIAEAVFKIDSCGHEAFGAPDIENRQWDNYNILKYDFLGAERKMFRERMKNFSRIGMRSYINSGVVMLFLDEIRKNGIDWYKERLKLFWKGILKCHFHHPDQDFINVFMDTDPSGSVLMNKFGGDAKTNCVFQHFVGGSKRSMKPTAREIGC